MTLDDELKRIWDKSTVNIEERWKGMFRYMLKEKFSINYVCIDDFTQGPKYLIIFWMWHVHIMIKLFLPQLIVSFPSRKKYAKKMLDGNEMQVYGAALRLGWHGGMTENGWRW